MYNYISVSPYIRITLYKSFNQRIYNQIKSAKSVINVRKKKLYEQLCVMFLLFKSHIKVLK